jgi:alkylation response protein AidB-like acyl-CoA dehydrogenase
MMPELALERLKVGIIAIPSAEGVIENTIIYTKQQNRF